VDLWRKDRGWPSWKVQRASQIRRKYDGGDNGHGKRETKRELTTGEGEGEGEKRYVREREKVERVEKSED
jgi:hypothetical protein